MSLGVGDPVRSGRKRGIQKLHEEENNNGVGETGKFIKQTHTQIISSEEGKKVYLLGGRGFISVRGV